MVTLLALIFLICVAILVLILLVSAGTAAFFGGLYIYVNATPTGVIGVVVIVAIIAACYLIGARTNYSDRLAYLLKLEGKFK